MIDVWERLKDVQCCFGGYVKLSVEVFVGFLWLSKVVIVEGQFLLV